MRRNPYHVTKSTTIISNRQDAPVPLSIVSDLTYADDLPSKTNAGQQQLYYRYRVNDANDENPLILTGVSAGYNEMGTLYVYYKVLSVDITTTVVNNEAFPVSFVMVPSNIDLATFIVSPVASLNLLELPLAKRVELAPVGGQNRSKIRMRLNLAKFSGDPRQYLSDMDYGALFGASPVRLIWVNMAALTPINFTAAGITQFTTIRLRIRWTQRRIPVISNAFDKVITKTQEERELAALTEFRIQVRIAAILRPPQRPNVFDLLASKYANHPQLTHSDKS